METPTIDTPTARGLYAALAHALCVPEREVQSLFATGGEMSVSTLRSELDPGLLARGERDAVVVLSVRVGRPNE